ncbi:MarR family winged helix-turn-helix transcriptional regulator [Ktedonobacter racemifer]|uniref:Transcriptional regulator, MarR family n=1 Tax=Ktedonobacter racemifer DSM 44963 TaxID=485913 RepID=D6U1X0_KTERA|nr:MarR family transcriptional regulator [Ktedonobacter racemifer]EFH80854.1 transcriptional regulator, MarR family [Ktedonobacter racemifer DSM 44963]
MRQMSQDDILKLDRQLCFALYAATRAMTNAYRELLTSLGLTYPQYLVMLVLWEHGTSTMKDLGQMLYLDSGTLTPLLKRLEIAGLVERIRSHVDERSVEVHLTEAGLSLKNQAPPIAREFICRTALESEAFTNLREHLHQLTAALSATGDVM